MVPNPLGNLVKEGLQMKLQQIMTTQVVTVGMDDKVKTVQVLF